MCRKLFILTAGIVCFVFYAGAVEYACTFDTDLCGYWDQDNSSDIDWQRKNAASNHYRHHNYPGPFGGKGFYLRAIASSHTSKARIESLELIPGRVNMTFYCKQYTGCLKVYRKWGVQMDEITQSGTAHSRHWIKKTIHFDCQIPCQIVIEAHSCRGNGIVDLDQVTINLAPYPVVTTTTEMPKQAPDHIHWYANSSEEHSNSEVIYCNFNDDNCSGSWMQDVTDDFDWLYHTGGTDTPDTGPKSGYLGQGYYMLLDASSNRSGQKTRLQSVVIEPGTLNVTFWYSMYGYDVGRLRVYREISGSRDVQWTKYSNQGSPDWLMQNLSFPCFEKCRVVFEAERGVFEHGDIGLDEITVIVTHDLQQDNGNVAVLRDFCDFESNSSWSQDLTKEVLWEHGNGPTPKSNTGPLGDYTSGTGNYALFQDSTDRNNLSAVMSSHVIRAPFRRQLTFAYHMLRYNNQSSQLRVYTKLESSGKRTLIWKVPEREGVYKWQTKTITVTSPESYSIQFEAVGGSGGYGDIAVDNIEIITGVLPEITDCSFMKTLCEWTQSTKDDFDWLLNSGATPTPQTGPIGSVSYIYTDASFPRVDGDVAILESKAVGPLGNQSMCIRFLYNMYGTHVGSLEFLRTGSGGESSHVLWTRSGNQGQKWWPAYVTIPFVNDDLFRFQFKSRRRFGIRGDIAVRNVTTDLKACREDVPYDCNFDQTMCGWQQSLTDAGNWTLAHGQSNDTDFAPSFDHNIGSIEGGYLLLSSSRALSSVFMSVTSRDSLCVHFWYFSYGSDHSDKLDFWTRFQGSFMETIKWTFSGETLTWRQARITVQSNLAYKIGFRSKTIDGFAAVDDIVVTKGACK